MRRVAAATPHRRDCVLERRGGEPRRLARGEHWLQPGLDSTRDRFLGEHDNGRGMITHGACGGCSAALMSRTARQAPSGEPVTFDRPRRGR